LPRISQTGPVVQTTPHLFGWLFFTATLGDGDRDQVILEHESLGRPLKKFFLEMYRALELRLAQQG